MTMISEEPFAVGDVVETIKGAKFWGEVVSCYRIPSSTPEYVGPDEWRADVRAIAPDFLGTIHVYPTAQLSLRTSPPPSGEAGEAKLTGYLFRLRYGPDNWSHQMMYAEALPKEGDYREVTPLYALPTIKEPTDGPSKGGAS